MIKRALCALLSTLSVLIPTVAPNHINAWASFKESDGVYARVSTDEKVIALTFDDGPHPYLTDKVLRILESYGVRATFFVVGSMARAYPSVLKRVSLAGHELGNHTYTHLAESDANIDKLRDEIIKTEQTVFDLTARKTFLFRPPTGYCCGSAVKMTGELGYKTVVWDIDTKDWTHRSPSDILREVKRSARNGSIILFHDFIGTDSPTPEALKLVIPYLLGEGYTFVTVGEMIKMYS